MAQVQAPAGSRCNTPGVPSKDRVAKTYRFKPEIPALIDERRGQKSATAYIEGLVVNDTPSVRLAAKQEGTPTVEPLPRESRPPGLMEREDIQNAGPLPPRVAVAPAELPPAPVEDEAQKIRERIAATSSQGFRSIDHLIPSASPEAVAAPLFTEAEVEAGINRYLIENDGMGTREDAEPIVRAKLTEIKRRELRS